jgi:GrpB-like predicted nucleotidyltransferase (UPF0157 family)
MVGRLAERGDETMAAPGDGGTEAPTTIGLGRHTVRVVAHRHEWHALFKSERRALLKRVGHLAVDVQHVGSTAVTGLYAKPIIDIALAVPTAEDVPRLQRLLEGLGCIYRGDAGSDGGHLFVKESAPDVRTHHLHVVSVNDRQWREWLLFRDELRANEALRASYAVLKKDLQERFTDDRKGYTEAKNAFVESVVHPPRGPGRKVSRP